MSVSVGNVWQLQWSHSHTPRDFFECVWCVGVEPETKILSRGLPSYHLLIAYLIKVTDNFIVDILVETLLGLVWKEVE